MNKNMKDSNFHDEIVNLNLADLDVEELENRLELAVLAAPDSNCSGKHKQNCWTKNYNDSVLDQVGKS
jgi:hypothetical protein